MSAIEGAAGAAGRARSARALRWLAWRVQWAPEGNPELTALEERGLAASRPCSPREGKPWREWRITAAGTVKLLPAEERDVAA